MNDLRNAIERCRRMYDPDGTIETVVLAAESTLPKTRSIWLVGYYSSERQCAYSEVHRSAKTAEEIAEERRNSCFLAVNVSGPREVPE